MATVIQKKIALLGAAGVGKTSLVRRFVQSLFDEKYLTTIGNGTYSGSYVIGGASVGVAFDTLFADEPTVAPVPEKGLASPSGEG